MQEFFASSVSGCEEVLCDELRELGFKSVRLNKGGGIPFRGEWIDGWRACLQSRIAQRIQVLLGRFPSFTQEELYAGIQAIDWGTFITSEQTISVRSVCRGSEMQHSGFVALKTKDAIVDQIRAKTGSRPSVSKDDPDVRIFVYLVANKATVYLDLSGDSLHKRGYRMHAGDAPLRETVAAAILRMSGWDRITPLVDPMCGAGTLAIEAAMWASSVPPGLTRGRFGFERWANFGEQEEQDLRKLCGELRRDIAGKSVKIIASDSDAEVLEKAKLNARAAGVRPSFKERPVTDLQSDGTKRIIVTNPPYGVRMEIDPAFVAKVTGRFIKLSGWRVCMLDESGDYERSMTIKPVKKIPLLNGALECNFLIYDIP